MGKYLNTIEISPSDYLYSKEKSITMVEETRGMLYAINIHFKRSVLSNFGKVVVKLWPEDKLSEAPGPIPRYEYDTMSNVAMINVEYDIDQYIDTPDISDRNLIAYNILKDVFSGLPEELGLDGNDVIKVLEAVREAGFIYTKLAGRKVRSPSKKTGAQLRYVFDSTGKHASAIIDRKGEDGETEVPIASYTIYDFGIMESPSKLVFIDENTLELQHKDERYESVRVSLPE